MSGAPVTASFRALGTTAAVAVEDASALAEARARLRAHLDALDRACSRFRPDSELMRLNARAGSVVEVGELLFRALRVALDAARMSDGLVDPTLGANMRAAGYDRTFTLVRQRGRWQVTRPAPCTSWTQIELDRGRRAVRVPPGVELDLGATAKALAADDAARTIATEIGAGVLVSLGGDLAVAGLPPAGGWPVLVADDHAAPLSSAGQTVALSTGGLATSSTAVRRWPTDAGEAHHILDPRSGTPARTIWRTVTVAAASCVDANVAATTAVVLGEDALGWLGERRLPARVVHRDGSVLAIGGWPEEARAA